MARLNLTLLGGFQARLDDRVVGLSMKKGQALLSYLAIAAGNTHLRDKLATLLWGDMGERQAPGGAAPGAVHAAADLGDAGPLRVEGDDVALDPELVGTDVEEFQRVRGPRHARPSSGLPRSIRGICWRGYRCKSPPSRNGWSPERSRLRELALEALGKLLVLQRDAGVLESGVQTALRLVTRGPGAGARAQDADAPAR